MVLGWHGIRKLSVTISLSHPDEYVGGNLEFDFRNQVDWENNKKSKIKSCDEIRPIWFNHCLSTVLSGTGLIQIFVSHLESRLPI